MPERPRPDLSRVRDAMTKRDDDVPEAPEPEPEPEPAEDEGEGDDADT